ncbi:hypothetical protein GCM10007854_05780 [Algimonas porphyrae]|uniref:Uncharacterized protein n=1 Tax=Algimonas porphyrae TaxID=1128113 RepID=A0ABQ5UWF5_9PROT|nr:hypothetical protein GCM10007854_05780 [Algimonas porphyrae]
MVEYPSDKREACNTGQMSALTNKGEGRVQLFARLSRQTIHRTFTLFLGLTFIPFWHTPSRTEAHTPDAL